MVLQTLVEGMVLEAHISSENVTNPSPVHLVELYSQYGSQVSGVWVCGCVGVGGCGVWGVRLFYVFTYPSSSADAHICQQRAGGPGGRCVEGGLILIV